MKLLTIALFALLSQAPVPAPSAHQDPPQRRDGQMLKLYDVRDIAQRLGKDFEAPKLGVPRPIRPTLAARDAMESQPTATPDPAVEAAAVERGARVIEMLARSHVQPPLADPNESLRATQAATLVANLLPDQHAWLSSFLDTLRAFDDCIEVRARFIELPRGRMKQWEIEKAAVLDGAPELDAFLARVRAEPLHNELTAPTLTTLPAQRAYMSVGEKLAYIGDWAVHVVEPGSREIADPEIHEIEEGMLFDARAVPLPGGLFGLTVALQQAVIERPIATKKLRIGSKSDVEVEVGLPKVESARIDTQLLLRDGSSAVLVVTPGPKPGLDLVAIVSVRSVERETPAKK